MNYFENRFFNSGFKLILVSGAMSIFMKSMVFQIMAGIFGLIGMISLIYGIREFYQDKKVNEKTTNRNIEL